MSEPTDDEMDDYGYAIRDMLAESLAVLPPTDAQGITMHDRGGDILEFTLAGQTVLMVDRATIAARVAARRRAKAD